jgi:hypothetical protein
MRDQQAPSDQGLISGYVLKLTRESLGLTQEGLAEHLDVDKHTLQAWESGRRPLSATQVFGFVGLRNRLRVLGAAAPLVDTLSAAMEADYVLGYTLGIDADAVDPCSHPLARWVLPQAVSEMIAWAVTGHTPPGLASCGTYPDRNETNVVRRGNRGKGSPPVAAIEASGLYTAPLVRDRMLSSRLPLDSSEWPRREMP